MSTYSVPAGKSAASFFAALPPDATEVRFDQAAKYPTSDTIILPRRPLIIDGCGAYLPLSKDSTGFTCPATSMAEAAREAVYTIKNFAGIRYGLKAIDLQGTLRATVENCKLMNQTEAAIDLRFALMTKVDNVDIVQPEKYGVRLRQGDWARASATNSCCHQSVLERVRVYCRTGMEAAFDIHNVTGLQMLACTSEGGMPMYDIYLTASGDESKAARNPIVKNFHCDGFHSEHGPGPSKASIYVNMPPAVPVTFERLFFGNPGRGLINYTSGQLYLSQIGWWTPTSHIDVRCNRPRIRISNCHNTLLPGVIFTTKTYVKTWGSFRVKGGTPGAPDGPLLNVESFDPMYVNVGGPNNG